MIGRVNQNILPLPSWLLTPIFPPINCTSCAQIARPKPVPPNCRVVEPSACENASKISCWAFSGIPIPVSSTETCNRLSSSSFSIKATRAITLPCWVNLSALPTRLISIWRMRLESPNKCAGTCSSTSPLSSKCFCCACEVSSSTIPFIISRGSKFEDCNFIFPDSIFEKSRMSSISSKSSSPEERAMLTYSI